MQSLKDLKAQLEQITGIHVEENIPMSKHTSFCIGGPADIFVQVYELAGLQEVLRNLHSAGIPYFVLGKGSNLLVGDRGIRGVVIRLTGLDKVEVDGTRLIAETGVSLAKLSLVALEAQLTGIEFASGIPGSLGGAVVMNAGAYDGEMKHVISSVTALTAEGEKRVVTAKEADLGYRHSLFTDNGWLVVAAELALSPGDPQAIRAKMDDLNNRRKEKQPLEYPSAGSAFKRPAGYYAGALIQAAGLKGYAVGDAQISEKHAGFIINRGQATAQDVLNLIHHVQEQVMKTSGVQLEPEIRLVGEF